MNDQDLKEIILATGKNVRFNPGSFLFQTGDKAKEMFYLISGSIQMINTRMGNKSIEEGEFIGARELILGEGSSGSALVTSHSRLILIESKAFNALLEKNPAICGYFIKDICRQIKEMAFE